MKNPTLLLLLLVGPVATAHENPGDRFIRFAGFDPVGPSRIRETGDAGEYEAWICYSTPHGEIQFNSGEMGGGTDLLGSTISKSQSAADCPKPARSMPAKIGGLGLGMTRSRFRKILGTDTEWNGAWGEPTSRIAYPYANHRPSTQVFPSSESSTETAWSSSSSGE